MAEERVVVGVHVDDDATRPLRRIERQSKDTGRSLRRMDDDTKGFDRTLKRLDRSAEKAMGKVVGMLKFPAIATGVNVLAGAVGALGAAAAASVAGLSPLVGTVAALPALAVAAVGAMGVIKLATAGVGDALKVALDPKATVQQYQDAMRDLTPEARKFVGELGLMRKEAKGLQQEAQRGLFPGLQDALKSARGLLPTVRTLIGQNARALGDLARQGAAAVATGPWRKDIATIGARNARLTTTLGQSLGNLGNALRHVIIAAGPMVQTLAEAFRGWTRYVSGAAAAGRESGRLERFFNRAGKLLRDTLHTIGDYAAGIFNVFREGTSLGNDMGHSVADVGRRFREWSRSDAGRERVRKFFADSKPVIYALVGLVGALVRVFGKLGTDPTLAPLIDRIRLELVPALSDMLGSVGGAGGLGNAIVTLATAWVQLMSTFRGGAVVDVANAFADTVGWIAKIIDSVPGLRTVIGVIVAMRIAVLLLNIALGKTVKMLAVGAFANFGRAAIGADIAATGLSGRLGLLANRFIQLRAMSSTTQALKFMLRTGVAPLTAGLEGLAAAVGLTLGPFLLIVAAIALVVAGVVLLWKHWDGFTKWLSDHKFLFAVISVIAPIVPLIAGITWALRTLHDHWAEIWQSISEDRYVRQTIEVLKDVWGWVGKVIDGIKWIANHSDDASIKRGAGSLWHSVTHPWQIGDTRRPRTGAGTGVRRSLARSMAVHAALAGPGQKVTSGYRTHSLGSPGSDHARGRAWDVTGPGLGRYATAVRAAGGFAEMHGSGPDRHLHAAIGDTPRPRAGDGGTGGGDVYNFHPGAIQVLEPQTAFDVEQAVADGIDSYVQNRRERGSDDGGWG